MRTRRLLLVFALVLFSVGAKRRGIALPERGPIPDVFTASNPTRISSTHIALDLTVDFNTQVLRGSATHTLLHKSGDTKFILDTSNLNIDGVTVDGKKATWTFGVVTGGSLPLIVTVDPKATTVRVDYHTQPNADGLHWLKARETRSGAMPAVWSENEPDRARTWIPIQDTPFARATYDATIHVPAGEMALMSAANNPRKVNANGVYTFTMPHPIPAYLIALTVGQYEFRSIGDRTGVYAEPILIDDSAWETKFLEDMLSAAERAIGPYPFERYDIVYPPKYPGGMENPELNFIGQDLITGNHPDVVPPRNLIAHEMAHSWFGDLMTCAQWNDLWLNEGFANYFSMRIDQEMGATELSDYVLVLDRKALDDFMTFKTPDRLQVLHRTFVGSERPSFTTIYYQKGEIFLQTLEDRMGRAAFDAFIRRYEENHQFRWVDDVEFRDALLGSFFADAQTQADLQIDAWIYGPGIPSNVSPKPTSSMMGRVEAQANAFRAGTPASSIDRTGWGDVEENYFLSLIQDLIVSRMNELDGAFGFSQRKTPPPFYLTSAAKSLDAASKTLLDRYLAIGKPSSEPVWYALGQTPDGRVYGASLYARVRDVYDPTARQIISGYLNVTP